MAAKYDPSVQAIWDALETDPETALSKATSADASNKDPEIKLQIKEAFVNIYLAQENLDKADEAVDAMSSIATSDSGKAKAALCSAQVLNVKGEMDKALEKAEQAFAMCKEPSSQAEALRAKMSICLSNWKYAEAKEAAQSAVTLFSQAGDASGEASAHLMVAEACLSNGSVKEAYTAAFQALTSYKGAGNVSGQGAALTMMVNAGMDDAGIKAAEERLALFTKEANEAEKAQSQLLLASAYVARLAQKISKTCSVASLEDSMGALKAAKEAFDGFTSLSNYEGQDASMREVFRVLNFNSVPGEMLEAVRNPTEALDQVMSGAFSNAKNVFPAKAALASKNAKIEEIIPAAKQLDKGKFAWNRPLDAYYYTLIWQPAKDREAKRKPRGSYEVLTTATGTSTGITAPDYLVKSNDAAERNKAMVVFMYSPDCYWNYTASFMALMNTFAACATSNVKFITTVHFTESHQDMATAGDNRMRPCGLYNCTTGIVRSARIELPAIESGFVCGDVASWMSDPVPIIENIFDTVEGDEGEYMYKRNEPFAPLLVHRPPEEEIVPVKPPRSTR